MSFFDKKSQVWVFCCTKNFSLGWSDLLVYSHLAYKSRFGCTFNVNRVAWNCGLSHGGAKASINRLTEAGLIENGKPVCRYDMFMRFKTSDKDYHWTKNLQYWKCLIRSDESPLSQTDVMVYSFLLHGMLNKFEPDKGWTDAYIARCLRMDETTIRKCLVSLEQHGLFGEGDEGEYLIADVLNGHQLPWFRNRESGKKRTLKSLATYQDDRDARRSAFDENYKVLTEHCKEVGGDDWKEILCSVREQCISKCSGQLVDGWQETIKECVQCLAKSG